MYVDSHVHLSHRLYDGQFPCLTREQGEWRRLPEETREGLVEALREAGVTLCLEPGIDLASLDRLMALAECWPDFLLPAVGIHPTRVPGTPWRARHVLEALSQEKSVAAIGELGLDYHLPRREQHRLRQKLWFCWQLSLAHRRELPLVLHIRQADGDAIRILRRYRGKLHGGVCHCFQGDAALARIYTRELGLYLGIGGALLQTPERCAALEEAVRETPLSFLLLETDGPYVKPARPEGMGSKAWQKTRNSGLILPAVAERIAELKGVPPQTVAEATAANARRLFCPEGDRDGVLSL